jgi:hypothetical protein
MCGTGIAFTAGSIPMEGIGKNYETCEANNDYPIEPDGDRIDLCAGV